ncbi:MAG: hypothetical protein ACUZ8E_05125 [Candidatus Anammoxibacter sp.]
MAKKFWLFGIAALAVILFTGSTSFAYDSEKSLCSANRDAFLIFKDYAGQLGVLDEEFEIIAKAGQQILDAEKERQSKFGRDKNYSNISKLLQIHAGDIVKFANEIGESAIEDIGYSYRFVFLSCRACHMIYEWDQSQTKHLSP